MLPVVALIQSILILGIILILSSLNAYIQDLEYIVSFLLTMGMYATPLSMIYRYWMEQDFRENYSNECTNHSSDVIW